MRIQQVAKDTGLSQHTLRYYERQGLIWAVPRDEFGHRYYREQDVHWLKFIQCLKMTGMPLKDIQAYAKRVVSDDKQPQYLLKILAEHKQRLEISRAEIDECLKHISWKIEHYQNLL
ncbi:MerR family transcriptional regulator [Vibrio sp. LaRot3]|uniref:MerR family transcriptional regulator n=1 Tax=Vibrio sp. LaRot3 TaxID=2998829 RepID=UPI0022CE00F5|nr:MerR family transcriptional regulator [Vibrio sp. LaRot3]MDA0146873.1 MerR family transcriptional regulator [Vibrio sp. LaRot3]